jgi:hypothetical protein
VLGDFRIEEFAPQRFEALEGAALVGADQPRIARRVCAWIDARRRSGSVDWLDQVTAIGQPFDPVAPLIGAGVKIKTN